MSETTKCPKCKEVAAEVAACIAFLQAQLGWEVFWEEGFCGEEAKSEAKQNVQALRKFLDEKGHGKAVSLRIAELEREVERLRAGFAEIRDVVLHGRNQLEGGVLDSDQTNAVLGVIDDAAAEAIKGANP
jgi:hypothetical protein